MTKIPVSVVPPVTPFADDLTVDYDALERIVDYVIEDCNAGMVIAAGVEAQEYQYLSLADRKELLARTIAFTAGRRPIVAGISHPSIGTVLELAEFAARQGASVLQLLAPQRPIGGPPSTGELVRLFGAVAAAVDLPLMLYLNAGPGADLSPAATVELSTLDGVAYVKESSRDMARIGRLIVEIDDAGHARYLTTMQVLLPSLLLGGSGVTLPPPAARIADLLIKAFLARNLNEAARLQKQFSLFPAQWMHYGLAPVMKAALNHLGVAAGEPFPPYSPVSGADFDRLGTLLDATDLKKAPSNSFLSEESGRSPLARTVHGA